MVAPFGGLKIDQVALHSGLGINNFSLCACLARTSSLVFNFATILVAQVIYYSTIHTDPDPCSSVRRYKEDGRVSVPCLVIELN